MLFVPGHAYCCMHWVIPGLHAIHSPFEEHPNDNLPLRKLRYNQALITCSSERFS